MLLETLRLKNWCQHKSLTVHFRPGINGILGRNGKGKSNLLDALRFVLTGESINDGVKTDNLTWGEKKGSVTLDFVAGDTRYELIRHIDSPKVTLTWNDEKLTKDKEVAAELVKLFKATSKTMNDNVLIPQGKINEILNSKPAERIKEFQATFGLTRMEQAYQLLGSEVNSFTVNPQLPAQLLELVNLVLQTRKDYEELGAKADSAVGCIAALEPAEEVIKRAIFAERVSRTLQEAEGSVIIATHESEKASAKHVMAKHHRDHAAQTYDACGYRLAECTKVVQDAAVFAQLQVTNNLARDKAEHARLVLTGPRPAQTEVDALRSLTEQLNQELARLQGMITNPATRPKLPQELVIAEQLHAAHLERASVTNPPPKSPELLALEADGVRLATELKGLGTGICSTCKQAVAGGPALVAAKTAELEAARATWTALNQAFVDAHQAAVRAADAKALNLAQQLVAFETAGVNAVQQAIQAVQPKREQAVAALAQATALAQRWDVYENLASAVRTDLVAPDESEVKEAQLTLTRIEVSKNALMVATSQVESLKAILDSADDALKRAKDFRARQTEITNAPSAEEIENAKAALAELSTRRVELAELDRQLGSLKATLDQRERDATRMREQVAHEEADAAWVEECRVARDALHYTQLPSSMMREYARLINSRIEFYLKLWETPWKFTLDDNLAFRATFAEGETSGSRLSGGQQVVASASFRLAMSDTFAKDVGLLVFDEPSNHLDKENIQHLQQLLLKLKELSAHTGRQILVVTHEASLTGFLDHVVEI